jgi:hypothetical protein
VVKHLRGPLIDFFSCFSCRGEDLAMEMIARWDLLVGSAAASSAQKPKTWPSPGSGGGVLT